MKRYLTLIFLLLTAIASFAQDPHFSQYFASPLSLNPACTGFFDGDLRLAVNERRQWYNVGSGYNTTVGSDKHQHPHEMFCEKECVCPKDLVMIQPV